jgi:hypothetical protein
LILKGLFTRVYLFIFYCKCKHKHTGCDFPKLNCTFCTRTRKLFAIFHIIFGGLYSSNAIVDPTSGTTPSWMYILFTIPHLYFRYITITRAKMCFRLLNTDVICESITRLYTFSEYSFPIILFLLIESLQSYMYVLKYDPLYTLQLYIRLYWTFRVRLSGMKWGSVEETSNFFVWLLILWCGKAWICGLSIISMCF